MAESSVTITDRTGNPVIVATDETAEVHRQVVVTPEQAEELVNP